MPLVVSLKDAYLLWQSYFVHLTRTVKYTLGEKIDYLMIEALEASCAASFSQKSEKIPHVSNAIRKLDTVKVLLQIAWETKALNTQKYTQLSEKLDQVGKMLGGWHGQLIKQNSPNNGRE